MSFKPSYNKPSTSYSSSNKSSVNAFRTGNPKVSLVPVLTAASFPSLSETTCTVNTCKDVDNSYLTKVKKVNILEKDFVDIFVQVNNL